MASVITPHSLKIYSTYWAISSKNWVNWSEVIC